MKKASITIVRMLLIGLFSATTTCAFSTCKHMQWKKQPKAQPPHRPPTTTTTSSLHYTNHPDGGESSDRHNAWNVLSNTEEWISSTLNSKSNNPYARKEVSYVCENQQDSVLVLSSLFKWLKEARLEGEGHAESETDREEAQDDYTPSTLRRTQVIVIPSSPELESFPVFDDLIQAVNQARRNARDYILDVNEEELDWNIAINCAHLHPNFGEKTPEQELDDLKNEQQQQVDVNYEEYKKARLVARQSPYPSVVIEVRASPAPDLSQAKAASTEFDGSDIAKLEELFGKTAHMKNEEDRFWDQIGNTIQEVSVLTPIRLAETFIAERGVTEASFTESSCMDIDEAYEFVFINIAMMSDKNEMPQFLVMPRFVSNSATSFEKFRTEVEHLLQALPSVRGGVALETFHPEHVDPDRRSPIPILGVRRTE